MTETPFKPSFGARLKLRWQLLLRWILHLWVKAKVLPDLDGNSGLPPGESVCYVMADYALRTLAPDPNTGRPHRAMMLLYEGENAIEKIYAAAGRFDDSKESADTVRGTYGEYVRNHDGELVYFEPAVMVAPTERVSTTSAQVCLSSFL